VPRQFSATFFVTLLVLENSREAKGEHAASVPSKEKAAGNFSPAASKKNYEL
jgi:hypothetical protein